MSKLTYEIVEHDGGWAYRADGTYSETYRTHEAPLGAAQHAAKEQGLSDADSAISYEDEKGRWHEEQARGDDRPDTEIKG